MSFRCIIDDKGIIQRPTLAPPPADTHKYARGSAVVVSGPALRTGASRLSARAALAVGAGLVTLIGDAEALREQAAHLTAIMLREGDPAAGGFDERTSAFAIGPAAGISQSTRDAALAILATGKPAVLDADALTCFADDPETLFAALHPQCVLTPHEGEFRRLFPDLDPGHRHHAVGRAATKCGAVVLLKGAETLIASPDGRIAINQHASPWLATAGSGDVLTGLVCGLLAQGQRVFEAACIAAWLHGDIGVRAGAGLTADAMVDWIPLVLAGCLGKGESR